jgi:hypothetical protein
LGIVDVNLVWLHYFGEDYVGRTLEKMRCNLLQIR